MIHAYDKVYLEKARVALGRMLEFAVYDLEYDLTDFFELFLKSSISKRFELGDYAVLVGRSGLELAYEILDETVGLNERKKPTYTIERSEEYWLGWALAYYQWETALKFSEIVEKISIEDIRNMYFPYHEMDIRQFVDAMNERFRNEKRDANLKSRRRHAGLSQSELAELSGIPVRTIQQYEQRQKNINKAQAEYLLRLSKVLCCGIEDLMEK